MSTDPYLTPSAGPQPPGHNATPISQEVMRQLAGTKPWVRFISVLMFVGAGFMLLGALALGLAGGTIFGSMASTGNGPKFSGPMGAGIGLAIAFFYGLFALLYIYPALKLWKYANRIGDLANSGRSHDLEAALNEQRAFWKFIGIMILAVFALYGAMLVLAMVAGGLGALRGSH